MNEVTTEALELVHKLETELEGQGEAAQPEAPVEDGKTYDGETLNS